MATVASSAQPQPPPPPPSNDDPLASFTDAEKREMMAFYGLSNYPSLMPEAWSPEFLPQLSKSAAATTAAENGASSSALVAASAASAAATVTTDRDRALDAGGASPPVLPAALAVLDDPLDQLGFVCAPGAPLAQCSLASRDFDPRAYIRHVLYSPPSQPLRHLSSPQSPTLNEFLMARHALKRAVDQREDVMKRLVKRHFDRFILSMNDVNKLYGDLRRKLESGGVTKFPSNATRPARSNTSLTSQVEEQQLSFGLDPLKQALNDALSKANRIVAPILERKAKADVVRQTLDVLERFAFLFNLPTVLRECVQKHQYEQAVKHYKKGRVMYESVVQPDGTNYMPELERTFSRIWLEVNRQVGQLRERLLRLLSDRHLLADEQEQHLRYLLELSPSPDPAKEYNETPDDPLWMFIVDQLEWIFTLMRAIYQNHQAQMAALAAEHRRTRDRQQSQETQQFAGTHPSSTSADEVVAKRRQRYHSLRLQKSIEAANTRNYQTVFGKDVETRAWEVVLKLVKTLSDVVRDFLPDFVGFCQMYLTRYAMPASGKEGHGGESGGTRTYGTMPRRRKPQATSAADTRRLARCQTMFQVIVDTYRQCIVRALLFSFGERMQSGDARFPVDDVLAYVSAKNRSPAGSEQSTTTTTTYATAAAQLVGSEQSQSSSPLNIQQTLHDFYLALREMPVVASLYMPRVVLTLVDVAHSCHRALLESHKKDATTIHAASMVDLTSLSREDVSAASATAQSVVQGQLLDIGGFSASMTKLLDEVKLGFVSLLSSSWIHIMRTFFIHEDWQLDSGVVVDMNGTFWNSTGSVRIFYALEKVMLRAMVQVACQVDLEAVAVLAERNGSTRLPNSTVRPSPDVLKHILHGFTESVVAYLDGVHFLAFNESAWKEWTAAAASLHDDRDLNLMTEPEEALDSSRADIRLLILIKNVSCLEMASTPKLARYFEQLFRRSMRDDMEPVMEAHQRLSHLLVDNYLARKSTRFDDIIRSGALMSGIDWHRTTRPDKVHGYVDELLVSLVLAHSEVQQVFGKGSARAMLKHYLDAQQQQHRSKPSDRLQFNTNSQTLADYLVYRLVKSTFVAFMSTYSEVDSMSKYGVAQALLDLLAARRVLQTYLLRYTDIRDHVDGAVKLLMSMTGSSGLTFKSQKASSITQQDLDEVNSMVDDWIKGCEVVFLCFK